MRSDLLAARDGTVAIEYALLTATLAIAVTSTGLILGAAVAGKLGGGPAVAIPMTAVPFAQPTGTAIDLAPADGRIEFKPEPPTERPAAPKSPGRSMPAKSPGAAGDVTDGWTSFTNGAAPDE